MSGSQAQASPDYVDFFGLVERPFSLAPDPRYYFRSRAHGRAFEKLVFGLRRGERFLAVAGDLGVGKTTLCQVVLDHLDRRTHTSFLGNPLVSPENFLRLLLQDFGAVSSDEVRRGRLSGTSLRELRDLLDEYLVRLRATREAAVIVIDEAHLVPGAIAQLLLDLAALEGHRETLQVLLVGQPLSAAVPHAAWRNMDGAVTTRAGLVPFEPGECAAYVAHRLTVAGAAATSVSFAPRAFDRLFELSGGVARLVNLLADSALQGACAAAARCVEAQHVDAAASALELLRARPRRFRWFGKEVS